LPLYTKADIEAEIAALKAKIHKAEDRQEYTSGGPGANAMERRGDLRAMYDRLAKLEAEWRRLEASEAGQSAVFVQFERPT
jgi:uncharacterized small protein (DUF1192 family)